MPARPNLLVVICHDLGRHLGCYGAPDVRSPHLDAFASQGVRFAANYCAAPQCSPSRAALWTGRFPHANGVVGLAHWDFANDLHPEERHLAQVLAAAGFETHLFGHQHVSPSSERCGFQHLHGGGPCREIAADVATFLAGRAAGAAPFFAKVAFFEPHRPFPRGDVQRLDPARLTVLPYLPDIPAVREDLADLEASVHSADRAFGRIVAALDAARLWEDTIVVFTADHGIAFPHAKMTLYDPGIQTALMLRLAGGPEGSVVAEMTSNVDFVPTVLDLLGLEAPRHLHGRSFGPLLRKEYTEYIPRDAIHAEKTYHTYYDPMRAIRTARWKLIANFEFAPWQETSPDYDNNAKGYVEVSRALAVPYYQQYHPPYELFDLQADPQEAHNLAEDPAHRNVRDGLIRRLREWMAETDDPLLQGPMAQGTYRQRMAHFRAV